MGKDRGLSFHPSQIWLRETCLDWAHSTLRRQGAREHRGLTAQSWVTFRVYVRSSVNLPCWPVTGRGGGPVGDSPA